MPPAWIVIARPFPSRSTTAVVPSLTVKLLEPPEIVMAPAFPVLPTPPTPMLSVPALRIIVPLSALLDTPRFTTGELMLSIGFKLIPVAFEIGAPVILIIPPPTKDNCWSPVIPPIKFNVAPESAPMLAEFETVISPLTELVESAWSAPALLIPVALMLSGSEIETPLSCNAAPLVFEIIVFPADVPRAPLLVILTAPWAIVNTPFQFV